MNGRRQSLTAPGGGGGGGGGGSRRILAATLTYTGSPGTRPNQITATVTGTIPDPSTILPGGTLQSIEYVARSLVDYSLQIDYVSLGVLQDARIPFYFNFGCGGAGNMDTMSVVPATISASATQTPLSNTDRGMNANATFNASLISSWGFTPTVSLRVGEPNYGRQDSTGTVGRGITYTSLQLDGTIQVYYLFE